MSHSAADSHSSKTGRRAVQYGFYFHRNPAGHGAGGVVGAAGVGIQGILTVGEQERKISLQYVLRSSKKQIKNKLNVNSSASVVHKEALG